jgi:hypothetical protein
MRDLKCGCGKPGNTAQDFSAVCAAMIVGDYKATMFGARMN